MRGALCPSRFQQEYRLNRDERRLPGVKDVTEVQLSAADQHEILVLEGWRSLQHEVVGDRQRIVISRARGAIGHCRLTPREFQSVYLAALGLASKLISVELGISAAFVRTLTGSALRKLGLGASSQLPALWHGLDLAVKSSPTALASERVVFSSTLVLHEPAPGLTSAERAVLRAVLGGHDNAEIAAQRNTSSRTVSNQLAVLFHKYGASSRAELVAQALRVTRSPRHAEWLAVHRTKREAPCVARE